MVMGQVSAGVADAMEVVKWAKQQHQHQLYDKEDHGDDNDVIGDGYGTLDRAVTGGAGTANEGKTT